MTGYAKGPFAVDWEERFDFAALRRKRIDRTRSGTARARGLDALLVWKDENVRYLTSLRAQLIACKSIVAQRRRSSARRGAGTALLGR